MVVRYISDIPGYIHVQVHTVTITSSQENVTIFGQSLKKYFFRVHGRQIGYGLLLWSPAGSLIMLCNAVTWTFQEYTLTSPETDSWVVLIYCRVGPFNGFSPARLNYCEFCYMNNLQKRSVFGAPLIIRPPSEPMKTRHFIRVVFVRSFIIIHPLYIGADINVNVSAMVFKGEYAVLI